MNGYLNECNRMKFNTLLNVQETFKDACALFLAGRGVNQSPRIFGKFFKLLQSNQAKKKTEKTGS